MAEGRCSPLGSQEAERAAKSPRKRLRDKLHFLRACPYDPFSATRPHLLNIHRLPVMPLRYKSISGLADW